MAASSEAERFWIQIFCTGNTYSALRQYVVRMANVGAQTIEKRNAVATHFSATAFLDHKWLFAYIDPETSTCCLRYNHPQGKGCVRATEGCKFLHQCAMCGMPAHGVFFMNPRGEYVCAVHRSVNHQMLLLGINERQLEEVCTLQERKWKPSKAQIDAILGDRRRVPPSRSPPGYLPTEKPTPSPTLSVEDVEPISVEAPPVESPHLESPPAQPAVAATVEEPPPSQADSGVRFWLDRMGLGGYADALVAAGLTEELIPILTQEMLEMQGVHRFYANCAIKARDRYLKQ